VINKQMAFANHGRVGGKDGEKGEWNNRNLQSVGPKGIDLASQIAWGLHCGGAVCGMTPTIASATVARMRDEDGVTG
jgi:hypothetical protein